MATLYNFNDSRGFFDGNEFFPMPKLSEFLRYLGNRGKFLKSKQKYPALEITLSNLEIDESLPFICSRKSLFAGYKKYIPYCGYFHKKPLPEAINNLFPESDKNPGKIYVCVNPIEISEVVFKGLSRDANDYFVNFERVSIDPDLHTYFWGKDVDFVDMLTVKKSENGKSKLLRKKKVVSLVNYCGEKVSFFDGMFCDVSNRLLSPLFLDKEKEIAVDLSWYIAPKGDPK